MNKLMWLAVLGIGFLTSSTAFAQATGEDAIRYRKSAYTVLLWNWLPMSAMLRDKTPYDKAKFALHASRVAALSAQLLEGFPKGSEKGFKTEALPAIWTNWADFQKKMQGFQVESQNLSKVAVTGDLAAIKTQFAKVGGTCKACHDKYKAE